jgi:hypothetical protein
LNIYIRLFQWEVDMQNADVLAARRACWACTTLN